MAWSRQLAAASQADTLCCRRLILLAGHAAEFHCQATPAQLVTAASDITPDGIGFRADSRVAFQPEADSRQLAAAAGYAEIASAMPVFAIAEIGCFRFI